MTDEHTGALDSAMDDVEKPSREQSGGTAACDRTNERDGTSPGEETALDRELREQREKAEEYLDQLRRTAAEFANYRKRNDKEREAHTLMSNAALITRLLPALDDLDRALQTTPDSFHNDPWVEGISLIQRKLQQVLEQEGVSEIEAVDTPFDPNIHSAVAYEDSEEHTEGTVIADFQKGYRLHDRVLRPSLVKVARST